MFLCVCVCEWMVMLVSSTHGSYGMFCLCGTACRGPMQGPLGFCLLLSFLPLYVRNFPSVHAHALSTSVFALVHGSVFPPMGTELS